MINVKLYGQPTSTYQYAKQALLSEARKSGIKINLIEIQDVNEFIKEGIKSVPTFKINNHLEINYTKQSDMTQFLKQAIQSILKEENFGTLKKILVPTDFSDTSVNAIDFALAMAAAQKNVVKIMHAYHPVSAEVNGISVVNPHLEQIKRNQLNELLGQCTDNKSSLDEIPFIAEEFRLGFASEEIREMSASEDIDLIVIGSTGAGGQLKKWFGSISLEVAKKAKCPVLIIPKSIDYQPFKNVLYATDNPILDIKVLSALADFIKPYDASLHLVHVTSSPSVDMISNLKNIAEDLMPGKSIIGSQIVSEDVVEGLNSYIDRSKIDLLVMAKEKRNLWKEVLHTSVTRKMAIHTEIPLMIYHDDDKVCNCGGECKKEGGQSC